MGKAAITLILLCSAVMAVPVAHGIAKGPKAVEEWFQKLSHKKEKLTKLRFYFHDTLSGKTPTAVRVAQANTTSTSPTLFGVIFMIDDPLTIGPQPNSTIVGRAQGFYGSAGIKDLGLLMTMNLVFTAGKFNGSSLSVLGRNAALEQYREMPVVGGSGVFRLARGIATAKTHWFDYGTGDAIVEYQVVVIHY
ncbi:Dirigent protein [Actinidia chinensis var. chinensis]|uniref:Dirigent protein n=1 Tax=Actinidia chinensis var. chinensis TaxID=1590841 RepID=A0A2R6R6X1_ACTCC|nr:Dirigent protein [Actinidia chinensis var. chinensis]